MKKLVMFLMAFCLMLPATVVNAQSKATKKEVKKKLKQYEKDGWKMFGSSRTLESALTKHYTTLDTDDNTMEIVGMSQAKSRNVAMTAAQAAAANRYATQASAQVKGRVLTDMASDSANPDVEFDKFYAAYEAKVKKEINGEMRPSFSVAKSNPDGTITVESYFIINQDAATKARMRAFENAQAETALAQKYAQKVSDFVSDRVNVAE